MRNGTGLVRGIDLQLARKSLLISQARRYASGSSAESSPDAADQKLFDETRRGHSDPDSVAWRSHPIKLAASMPRSRGLDPRLIRVASAATSQISPLGPTASLIASTAVEGYGLGADRRVPARSDLLLRTLVERHRSRRQPVRGALATNARQPAARHRPDARESPVDQGNDLLPTDRRAGSSATLSQQSIRPAESRHRVSERRLSLLQDPLSLLKRPWAASNLERLSRSSSG